MDDNYIKEMIEKYRNLSKKALEIAKNSRKGHGMENWAEEFIEMAEAYIRDSEYFEKRKDLLRALACIAYAHGWLDAGARIGVFIVKDPKLFSVD